MKVAVLTGTRAEFGLLTPVMRALEAEDAEVAWLVTGLHLLKRYGHTVDLVRQDPAPILAEVPYFSDAGSIATDFGLAMPKFEAALLSDGEPDWLVVLGDRHETLSCVLAASYAGIPVAHIHGGDRANSGHMDESQRHAITRFAALHLAASRESAQRLCAMGEEEWRIHMVGAPGIDRLRTVSEQYRDEIEAWGQRYSRPYLLVIFHAVSTEADQAGDQARLVFEVLSNRPEAKLVVYPNNDPGGEAILEVIKEYEGKDGWKCVPNLNQVEFVAAMTHARAFVGNSSSGIIEAPFFGLPMVHVGNRNLDREHAGHVTFVPFQPEEIHAAIDEAVTDKAHKHVRRLKNPYGDGKASKRMATLLSQSTGQPDLLRKMITY